MTPTILVYLKVMDGLKCPTSMLKVLTRSLLSLLSYVVLPHVVYAISEVLGIVRWMMME